MALGSTWERLVRTPWGWMGYGTSFPLSHIPAGGCIILLSTHFLLHFGSVSHTVLARGRVHLLLLRGQRGSLLIARHVPPQGQAVPILCGDWNFPALGEGSLLMSGQT
eukprot:5524110-Pyramimonas_sp.AAC.1